jgi:hypothetical protein
MLHLFPKIKYQFNGITQDVTDIFRSVNIVFDREDALLTSTILPGERPDQLSVRLYNNPNLYWGLFVANGIRNPLREWGQGQESYVQQIESEYNGWVYQFANISDFIPAAGSTGFTGTSLNPYEGTDIAGISIGDLIIYETGTGPFSIKCYGAGGVTSESVCGSPHYGQAIIPDNLNVQNDILQVSSGNYFSSCLDSKGYIYAWGKDIGLTTFTKTGNLYKSSSGGYSFIEASGDRIVAINSTGYLECFGDCTDFNLYSAGNTGPFVKTVWTNGISGGLGIKSSNSVIYFGLTGPSNLYNADCGLGFCVGILPSTFGLTAFGANNSYDIFSVPSATGITAVSVTANHALALDTAGTIYGWGMTADGQLDVPSGTYSKISAGRYHSAAINSDNSFVIWGKILKYGEGGCPGLTTEKVSPLGLSGEFNLISSGYEHITLKGSGENVKYTGVVDSIDDVYKRIFVKNYQFTTESSMLFKDPSGTVVSVWRAGNNGYEQIKTVQNQLLSIEKYLDSPQYVTINGQIIDVTTNNNWLNIYITDYQTADTNENFITLRKELMDIDLYNKTQIKQLSLTGVANLEKAIRELMNDVSPLTNNEIRISEL